MIAETVVTHKLRKTSAVEAVDAEVVLTQAAETSSAKPAVFSSVIGVVIYLSILSPVLSIINNDIYQLL